MANRFKDPAMLREYIAAMQAYLTRDGVLFLSSGARHRGSKMASFFWDGFDGTVVEDWDKRSKGTLVYAYWRAGQDAARRADHIRKVTA